MVVMLVGDAAHQINPMTGGGIASGMKGRTDSWTNCSYCELFEKVTRFSKNF